MDNEHPEVVLIKHAIRDFKKEIRKTQRQIESDSYMFIEDEKPKDEARVQGMIQAKIFFERYYKRYLHSLEEQEKREEG